MVAIIMGFLILPLIAGMFRLEGNQKYYLIVDIILDILLAFIWG